MVNFSVNVLFPYIRLWGQDVAVDFYSSCRRLLSYFCCKANVLNPYFLSVAARSTTHLQLLAFTRSYEGHPVTGCVLQRRSHSSGRWDIFPKAAWWKRFPAPRRLSSLCLIFPCCCSSLSHVRLFVTTRTAAYQAYLSFTISWSLLKLMSLESMMP